MEAFELRRKLISNMNHKLKNIEKNAMLSTAALLDSRFKKLHFSTDEKTIEKIKYKFISEYYSYLAFFTLIRAKEKLETTSYEQSNCLNLPHNDCNPGDSLWEFHDSIVETHKLGSDQDGIPVSRPVCDHNVNPL